MNNIFYYKDVIEECVYNRRQKMSVLHQFAHR